MCIFLEKICKNRLSFGGSAPEILFDTHTLFFPPTITTFSDLILALNVFYYPSKNNKITKSKCSSFGFSALLLLFFNYLNCKNISCRRPQSILAMPLTNRSLVTSKRAPITHKPSPWFNPSSNVGYFTLR